jgi:anti-anti-sigma factor
MEPVVIEYQPSAYRSLEAAVLAAIAGGAGRVVLDLDLLEALDTEAVRGLISLLRRSRAVGGDLALHASNPNVRRTLNVTALDRIFPMVELEAA